MAEEEVKLLGTWASPYAHRIEIALKLKGVKYEQIEQDLANKSSLLLKLNPVFQRVPVLVHNGNPISESLVILEYIDETWKNCPLLPQDPFQRAMARFWAKLIDDKLLPMSISLAGKEGDEQKQIIEEFQSLVKMLEKELEGKDFFGGQEMGYLDIVGIIIVYLSVTEKAADFEFLTEEKFPILYKWIAKVSEVDACKEVFPPKDKHLAYVKKALEKIKDAAK